MTTGTSREADINTEKNGKENRSKRVKNYNPMTKEHAVRAAIHIPVGITIAAAATFLPWEFAVLFSALFIIYELNEDKHLRDKAFVDIFGALIGLAGGIWWVILRYLSN